MRQQATVVAELDGEVLVRGRRASACGGCAGKAACGTLGAWRERELELRLPNRVGARAGDVVTIEVPDRALLRVAAMLYGLPMLAFLVGGMLAAPLASEGVAALAAIASAAASYAWILPRSRRWRLDARIVAVASAGVRLPMPARAT